MGRRRTYVYGKQNFVGIHIWKYGDVNFGGTDYSPKESLKPSKERTKDNWLDLSSMQGCVSSVYAVYHFRKALLCIV